MRYLMILACFAVLFGCSFHRQQNDLADNQYYKKERLADTKAGYIGVWAVDLNKWRKVLTIDGAGRVRVRLAPEYGSIEGKVYLENRHPFIILKDGTKTRIVNSAAGSLMVQSYGRQEELALR